MDWSNFLCNEPNLAWEGFIIVFLSGWEKQPTFLYSDSKKLEKHKLKIKMLLSISADPSSNESGQYKYINKTIMPEPKSHIAAQLSFNF
jgi:hypothetical protein